MKKVRIRGIGVICQAGITADALWSQLCMGEKATAQEKEIIFKPSVPSSRLRRINRYCKMALYASEEAWKDGRIEEGIDAFDRGTIFTTGYGAMAAEVKFCREVAKGDPDFCSPTVFTGTVPNSCVGTVCMYLNCKGVSTMLRGGNHLEYSNLLLENGQAKVILAGAVEEYSPELFEGLKKAPVLKDVSLSEGCAVFCLENTEEKIGYCTLEKTSTIGLPDVPFMKNLNESEAEDQMSGLLSGYQNDEPDLILGALNGTYFDELEKKVLEEVFPTEKIGGSVKAIIGETFGSGFAMNVAVGALCLRHGFVPAGLSGKETEVPVESLLVTGFDSMGNYMCALLKK